jgi:energy-converting hydrogenase Eha subunit G
MTNNEANAQSAAPARQQVSGPSLGLLITGVVGGAFVGAGLGSVARFANRWADDMPDWYEEMFEGVFAMGGAFVGLLVAAFIIFAALKMKDLKQWSLAVAASVLAMLPCISPCCVIGLPIGIWCLVILMRPEVKDAFT